MILRDYHINGLTLTDHVECRADDGQHFEAVIVKPAICRKIRYSSNQLVYLALGDRMAREIPALAMRHFYAPN